ncbi:MAG: chemotaxis protein CheW [Pseudomonadota bacterium]
MAIDMTQFYQAFFDEAEEHLSTMESILLELDIAQPDPEQLNAIFRAAHSIKGSGGTFGFTDITEVTHILETLLDRLRKNEITLRAEMVDAFLAAGDVLKGMIAEHRGDGSADRVAVQTVCARLHALADADSASASTLPVAPKPAQTSVAKDSSSTTHYAYEIRFIPTEHAAKDPAILPNFLEELRTFGTVSVIASPALGTDAAGLWHVHLTSDRTQLAQQINEALDFIADAETCQVQEVSMSLSNAAAESAYGFFDEPSLAAPAVEEAFGLFEETPAHTAPLSSAADGYGFFEPLPEIPASTPSVAIVSTAESTAAPAPSTQKNKPGTASTSSSETSSIRVGVEKVDQLVNLVGELVITQAMLLQCAEQMQEGAVPERLMHGLAQLERNTRDLQESVMSIRMLPISFVFSRFPRVVRDLSSKLGKQVELKVSGETTELDKSLIERIADPLTHLIRNSLDHGVEMPDARVAAGKPACGTITLRAAHQGGNIVIEVGDDGAGLNRAKILAKARERGLSVADQMTDQDVWALIFEAGFSTAEAVTDVSGRGVGMDVVRRNIQAMGGRVDIESMLGVGTRMTVRLPLTLAILDGMSVAVGTQTYIVPLSYIVESLQPEVQNIKTLANQACVIRVRGEYLPVIALHEIFGITAATTDFAQGIMIVLDADGTKAALFVDALLGQHQVVIKSLEHNFRRVAGISGATIMGDGHVALILDVAALAAMVKSAHQA